MNIWHDSTVIEATIAWIFSKRNLIHEVGVDFWHSRNYLSCGSWGLNTRWLVLTLRFEATFNFNQPGSRHLLSRLLRRSRAPYFQTDLLFKYKRTFIVTAFLVDWLDAILEGIKNSHAKNFTEALIMCLFSHPLVLYHRVWSRLLKILLVVQCIASNTE